LRHWKCQILERYRAGDRKSDKETMMTDREKELAGLLKEALTATRVQMAWGYEFSDAFCSLCRLNHNDNGDCLVDCFCHRAKARLAELEQEMTAAAEEPPVEAKPQATHPRKYALPLTPDGEEA
jgi:hypothetical protein